MALDCPSDPPPQIPSTDTLETSPRPPTCPDRIGRYHIKRVIASGGMGTVYEAVQESPRRVVAVKVMKQGIASKSALRRFEYESQILARLRHPGIAQIYEAGTHTPDQYREPGQGHAEKAAEWREKLEETASRQNAETPK